MPIKTAKFDFKKAKIERRENDYYIFAKSKSFIWDFYHLIVGDILLCWCILGRGVAGAKCFMSYPLFCVFCMANTPPISFAQKVCETERLGLWLSFAQNAPVRPFKFDISLILQLIFEPLSEQKA